MQASRCLFHYFHALTHFRITFFENYASCLHGEHNFEKRLRALFIKLITFLTPKRPQKRPLLSFYLLLSLFWPFRSLIFRFLSPLEFCVWPMTCAFWASWASSAKNDRMHHTYIFVNFVAIDATLHQKCKLQGPSFIFLCSNSVFDWHFNKIVLLATVGSTFSQNDV